MNISCAFFACAREYFRDFHCQLEERVLIMSRIDELLHEHSIHSVRSDGTQMIALQAGQNQADSEWEILLVQKNGSVENDGMILEKGEKAVLRLSSILALPHFACWVYNPSS